VTAATTERADKLASDTLDAARAAAPQGLIGVVIDAPSQLWARASVTHSGHPLLLDAQQRFANRDGDVPAAALTPREMDLLRLLPLSLAVNELAERLFVSVSNVKWHRANLYRKLDVRSRQTAISVAVERGLLTPPGP
jgi:DNA-binding NarL/FixJ family response regulator